MHTSSFVRGLMLVAGAVRVAAVVQQHNDTFDLVVTEPPSYVRPYIIPDLSGPAVVLINDVIRAPINNESSGGAFSLVQLNAQPCTFALL